MILVEIIDLLIFLGVVFQGLAINIGNKSTGFPIYLFTAAEVLAAVWLTTKLLSCKIKIFAIDKVLLMLLAYSIISLFFPLFFLGIMINSPRLGIEDQYQNHSKLIFNISSLGQLVYFLLNIITLQYFKISAKIKGILIRRFIKIQSIAVIGIFFGIWQITSKYFGINYPSNILYSSQFATNLENSVLSSGYARISSTFFESSYFGQFMVAVFFLNITIPNLSIYNILLAFFSLIMIVISTSWSAFITLITLSLLLLIFRIISSKFYSKKNISLKQIIGCALILITLIVLFNDFIINYAKYIVTKGESASLVHRADADQLGLELFIETFGLGLGIGNNATSSMLPYLLSNHGIIGTTLFIIMILLVANKENINYNSRTKSYTFAFISVIATLFISIGSISMACFWIFIFLIYSERSV